MKYSLSNLIRDIRDDLPTKNRGVYSFLQSYLYNASFRVLLNHRIGKYFFFSGNFVLRQLALRYKYKLITKRGCDISYKAVLGKGIKLPHPIGIVIGEGVIIKDYVMIFQQVTFGSHGKKGKDFEYPIIESHAKLFAGAKIIGGVTVGEYSIVGANTLVNKDVTSHSVAYGIPCKVKSMNQ
ncbi:serine O-acetyltransferase [Sphingobacterium thalpophilum]|uniref:serine O-acetyltransferase n=1 Tax=Sphingobacterium thalpophilum TaxID=259 RepID=UPI0037D9DC79